MKYKIVKIKRRNWFARIESINEWNVTIDLENGIRKTFPIWAHLGDPNKNSLLNDLQRKVETFLQGRKGVREIMALEGQEFDVKVEA